MKKILIMFAGLIMTAGLATAQKYAFVDTDYILSNIPNYTASQEHLNKLSEEWQKEIEEQYA